MSLKQEQHTIKNNHDEKTDQWFLYLIRCNNQSLYTGITTDVERRFKQHEAGKGARFLRGKHPLTLEFQTKIGTHSQALKAEHLVKKCSKAVKESILKEGLPQHILHQLTQQIGSNQMDTSQV